MGEFLLLSSAKKRGISSLRCRIKHSSMTAIRPRSETKQPCEWGPFSCTVVWDKDEGGGQYQKALTCCVLMQFTVAMTSVVTSVRSGISCLDAGTSPRNIQCVHCTFGGRAHGEHLQLVSPQWPRLHLCGRSHKLSLFQVSDNDLKQFVSGGSVCNSLVEKKILPQIVCIKISDVCYEETVSYPSASNVVTLYMVVPVKPSIAVLCHGNVDRETAFSLLAVASTIAAEAIAAVEGRIDLCWSVFPLCILIIPWGVLRLWRQRCRFRKATLWVAS